MVSVAEEWRPVAGKVAGWPYEISSLGRLRSIKSETNPRQAGKLMWQGVDNLGYERAFLYWRAKKIRLRVHRLVAEAFIEPQADRPFVNHKDGNKRNNTVENLEWVTRGENGSHAYRTGLRQPTRMRGSSNPHATLTEEKVVAIRRMLLQNVSRSEIADMMGVTKTTICSIHKKKSWSHVEL